jgi:hypothetical protein
MGINCNQHGYLRISSFVSKDIFFHSRYSSVYPAISFISSNSFIDIQLFIHLYPAFILYIHLYPVFLSCPLSLYIHIVSNLFILYILIFIPLYPDIYPAGYSILFSADPARRGVLLDWTLFCMSCSATG